MGKKNEILPGDLPFSKQSGETESGTKSLKDRERSHILQVLTENGWNISKTAEELEIDRVTLYNKIKKYNLEKSKND